jgi:hypothetical protein
LHKHQLHHLALPCLALASPAGWSEEDREGKRAALRRVLDGVVAGNASGIFYYQGLHDIAAVLLFVCGELPAYRLLRALAGVHLRDCTRPDLAATTETLRLLYPILEQCDPELHGHLMGLQEPALEVPYFALRQAGLCGRCLHTLGRIRFEQDLFFHFGQDLHAVGASSLRQQGSSHGAYNSSKPTFLSSLCPLPSLLNPSACVPRCPPCQNLHLLLCPLPSLSPPAAGT